MASIHREVLFTARPEDVWDAVRDVGNIHRRLCPGFVADCRMDGPHTRIVVFGNGMVVRERIIDLDDAAHRIAWSAQSERLTHHNASLQIFAQGEGATRAVWIADLLPDDLAGEVAAMIEQGLAAMRKTLERKAA
jgi:hypothetical protein